MMTFQNDLLAWYERNKRDLPFRRNKDPYAIWISEVMAQQTRIEALLKYYERFIELFPDVQSLAAADEDVLMKAWQGLGYYSRARSLHAAAKMIVNEYQGKLPETKKELMKLPGIGDYTAGAIASICHNEKVSAVDGNVIRVFARLFEVDQDIRDLKVRRQIAEMVEESLPEQSGDYNQALMELGALVCTPKSPGCLLCPISDWCQTRRKGRQNELPYKSSPKKRSVEHQKIVVLFNRKDQTLFLEKRPVKGLLAGLYGFEEERQAWRRMRQEHLILVEEISLQPYRHIFTHKEWDMQAVLYLVSPDHESQSGLRPDRESTMVQSEGTWNTLEQSTHMAIPTAFASFYQQTLQILQDRGYDILKSRPEAE